MIELQFIPDGASEVPAETRDHGILAAPLEGVDDKLPDDSSAPISGWKDVTRVVPGKREYIALQMPGEPADYPGNSMTVVENAILDNFAGVKKHPDGWTYIGQG